MIDALDWLGVADELASTGDEARLRTAIGRLYYAMFIKNRDSLVAAGLMSIGGDDTDHRAVFEALRSNRRVVAANAFRDLRSYRNRSDYETTITISESDWRKARQLARDIVRLCSADWEPQRG